MRYCLLIVFIALLSSCGIYRFNDAALNPDWKTVKINFFENTAPYVNPQLAQKFTDKLQQKITTSTKLTRTQDDNSHVVISSKITNYNAAQTVSIGAQQATVNRLTVSIQIVVRYNTREPKEPKDFTVSRSFDYSANKSLQQAEGELLEEVVRTMTDEIFNQIFSEW